MNYLIRGIILVIFTLWLVGCAKINHDFSGEAKIVGPDKIEISDTQHNVTILYGIEPSTLEKIEEICENQDDKPVNDCISDFLVAFTQDKKPIKENTEDGEVQ